MEYYILDKSYTWLEYSIQQNLFDCVVKDIIL